MKFPRDQIYIFSSSEAPGHLQLFVIRWHFIKTKTSSYKQNASNGLKTIINAIIQGSWLFLKECKFQPVNTRGNDFTLLYT